MSDMEVRSELLTLPRNESGLATARSATRRLQEVLPAFLESVVDDAGADGVVVTLDGTVESAVTAAVAVDALGADAVTSLGMPTHLLDEAGARQAEAIASLLDLDHRRLQLHPLLVEFQALVGTAGEAADDLVATENAAERFRMACAYYVANTANRLVVGSVSRTDLILGTVTKYGETGVDVAVLGDLFRTEVDALADAVDVPAAVCAGSATGAGTAAPSDVDRLDVDQRTLDGILRLRIDEGRSVATVASRLAVDSETVRTVEEWCAAAAHKRQGPYTPSASG